MLGEKFFGRQFAAEFGLPGAFLRIEARIARGMRRHEYAAIRWRADLMLAAHQVLAEGAGESLSHWRSCPSCRSSRDPAGGAIRQALH